MEFYELKMGHCNMSNVIVVNQNVIDQLIAIKKASELDPKSLEYKELCEDSETGWLLLTSEEKQYVRTFSINLNYCKTS